MERLQRDDSAEEVASRDSDFRVSSDGSTSDCPQTERANKVTEVRKQDIILGRGKGLQAWSGNIRMRQIVDTHKQRYQSLKKEEKRQYVVHVFNEITAGGENRFLKKVDNEDEWECVVFVVALEKLSHALRTNKKEKRARVSQKEGERSTAPAETHAQGVLPLRFGLPNPASHVARTTPPLVLDPAPSVAQQALLGGLSQHSNSLHNYASSAGSLNTGLLGMPAFNSFYAPRFQSTSIIDRLNVLRNQQQTREMLLLELMRRNQDPVDRPALPKSTGEALGILQALNSALGRPNTNPPPS